MSSNQPPWGGNGGGGWPPASGTSGPGGSPAGSGPSAPSSGHAVPASQSPYGPPSAPSNDPYAAYARPAQTSGAASNPYAPGPYAPGAQQQDPYRPAPPGSDPYAAYASRPTGYQGGQDVGGWLLLLCFSLTIGLPLATLGHLVQQLARVASLPLVSLIDLPVAIGLAVFSAYAGVALWSRRTGAVRVAKAFLVTRAAYALLSFVMISFQAPGLAFSGLSQPVIASVGFCIVWFLYLTTSMRVRATYGDAG